MIARTHVMIGFTYGMALLPVVERGEYTPLQFVLLTSGLVIGSLLPDIDHPQSTISRKLPPAGWIASKLVSHRGFFHSILGCVILFWLMVLPVGFFKELFQSDDPFHMAAGLTIGYMFHIFADMFTVSGVRLLFPFRWNIGLGVFKTGGTRETILRWGLGAMSILLVWSVFI